MACNSPSSFSICLTIGRASVIVLLATGLPEHTHGACLGAMELRPLRYCVAVAEDEYVSRAALKLLVSQPALSRQVRDLEDELGFPLLVRTGKSVRLTGADAGAS